MNKEIYNNLQEICTKVNFLLNIHLQWVRQSFVASSSLSSAEILNSLHNIIISFARIIKNPFDINAYIKLSHSYIEYDFVVLNYSIDMIMAQNDFPVFLGRIYDSINPVISLLKNIQNLNHPVNIVNYQDQDLNSYWENFIQEYDKLLKLYNENKFDILRSSFVSYLHELGKKLIEIKRYLKNNDKLLDLKHSIISTVDYIKNDNHNIDIMLIKYKIETIIEELKSVVNNENVRDIDKNDIENSIGIFNSLLNLFDRMNMPIENQ